MNTDNKTRLNFAGFVGIAAVLLSIGAGIYLLQTQSAAEETTVFDALMHGMGAYFVARGLWMARAFNLFEKGE